MILIIQIEVRIRIFDVIPFAFGYNPGNFVLAVLDGFSVRSSDADPLAGAFGCALSFKFSIDVIRKY